VCVCVCACVCVCVYKKGVFSCWLLKRRPKVAFQLCFMAAGFDLNAPWRRKSLCQQRAPCLQPGGDIQAPVPPPAPPPPPPPPPSPLTRFMTVGQDVAILSVAGRGLFPSHGNSSGGGVEKFMSPK